jgi:hypothetical protein
MVQLITADLERVKRGLANCRATPRLLHLAITLAEVQAL